MADQIPDRSTPLIGWRVWLVTSDETAPLTSVTQQATRWIPYQKHEAQCLCSAHNPLAVAHNFTAGHTCGIHAAKTLEAVIAYYQGCGFGLWTPACAIGRVRLGGRVVVHDNG